MRLKSIKLVMIVEHFAADVGFFVLFCLDVIKFLKSLEEIKPKIITPFIFENITTENLTFSYFLPGAARQTIAALQLGLFFNRPFPSSKKSHFQSEAKCEAIDMKMIFNYDANKTHFHNKGFALSLVLKVRFFGTRKWPIGGRMMVSTEQYYFCYVCWELRAIFHVNSSKKFLSFVLTINMATLLLSVGML